MSLARPADLVVVAAAAALVGLSWATLWTGGGAGDRVRITAAGQSVLELSLAEDRVVRVEGLLGESVIEVSAGRARFTDSPCVGRYCVHAGWLSEGGDVAACLPNGVVAEIEGRSGEYDAISF